MQYKNIEYDGNWYITIFAVNLSARIIRTTFSFREKSRLQPICHTFTELEFPIRKYGLELLRRQLFGIASIATTYSACQAAEHMGFNLNREYSFLVKVGMDLSCQGNVSSYIKFWLASPKKVLEWSIDASEKYITG